MKNLAVIIVNWNTKNLLRDCLNSIKKETHKYSYTIYVVDNNSPDNSAAMVREEFPDVRLIANSDNRGFAAANNQALRIADEEFLLLLNPDTIVINNALDRMIDFLVKRRDIGILTCKLLNQDKTLQKSVNNFFSLSRSMFENRFFADIFKNFGSKSDFFMSYWDHSSSRSIDWSYGAVMLFSRDVCDKVGLLDEKFFIYAEEMDYYIRVKKAGFTSYFLSDVEIIHLGKSSSRQRRGEMFIQNYKSFYIFLRKHYSSFTFNAYRIRTTFFLFLWIVKFFISVQADKLLNKESEENRIQLKVYFQTFKWHLTPNNFRF